MIAIPEFINLFKDSFLKESELAPWEITNGLSTILFQMIEDLNDEFMIENGIAIHKTAVAEPNAILKAPIIIGAHSFVSSGAYLREGVFLGAHVKIGPGCE